MDKLSPFFGVHRGSDFNYPKSLVPFFGDRYLYEIAPMMIERYKLVRKEKISVASVNRELALLKCTFNKAIAWNIAKENPVCKVKLFKENNWRTRYLEKEELTRLLQNSSRMLRAIITVAVNTGMRKAELQNLKWRGIDFHRSYIVLHHTKNDEKRFLPMNRAVREILVSVPKNPKSAYLFAGKDGEPFNFRKSFETALKKSGIFNFRFHDLRHTFASQLVMAGVDLNTGRELLGHKTVNMTLRYSHLSRDHKARAVEVLEDKMDTFWTPEPKLEQGENKDVAVSHLELVV